MSQVIKKLQTGGSITIDGIKYDATPEFINALTTHIGNVAGTDAQTLAGLTNALQNGENLTYNSASNTITGMNGLWGGITDRQNAHRAANTSRWRKFWDAQLDTDAHRFRNALTAIGSFHWQPNDKKEDETSNLKDIYGDTAWFDYIDNEDGTKSWSENSAKNAGLMQRLDDMTAYLSDPEAGKKMYRLASQYTPEHMSALQGLYNQSKDRWADTLNQIKTRARNNQLGEDDIKFLNNFFIAKPNATPEETEAAALAADKKRFADAGLDYDKWSPYLTWNSDKNYWNISGAGQEAFRSTFGGNGNYWFNDNFTHSQYNPTGKWDFLNGYFVLGDRLYKQSDAEDPTSELSQILRRKGGFRDLNAGMRHNEANALIEQLWGVPVEWEAPTGEFYSDWLDPNGNIYYRSRTGDYNWTGKDGNQQLVEWVAANPELADAFGYYTPRFKLTDKNGNELNKYGPENIAGLTQLADSQRYKSPFHRNKLWFSENGNSDFDGRYFLGDGYDDEGNVTGAGFWVNPNDPTGDWIYESDEMKNYVPDIEGSAVRVPKEMVAILTSNPDFIEKFQKDESGFRSKFAKVMAGAVGRGINFSTFMANAGPQAWMNLGFDRDTARKLAQMSRNYSQNQRAPLGAFLTPIKSNRGKRRAERMVHKPTLHKDGGKIEKAAYGDMMGRSSGSAATPTQVKTDKPIRDTREYTNFGQKLQPHDYIELGALLADAASIGLAFNPATSIASGATGIAGSTAGFLADIKRDGFQGSDLGQYGINLGLDALSFIPVLGGASKTFKVAEKLKKAAPIVNKIMKAAALYGIPHAAVQSWDAIQSGNFNMRDLRAVVNAVGGAVHMSRAGFRKPVRGQASIEYPTINLKAGKEGNPIKLTESQFDAIQRANPKTKEELAEQLGKFVNKTKEQVIDDYDLDDIFKHRDHRFGLFGKEVNKVKLKADKSKGKIQFEDISKNPRRRSLHEAYMDNLAGNRTRSYEIQTPDRLVADINVNGVQPIYREIADIPENSNITRPRDIVATVGKNKMSPKQVKIKKILGEKITRTKEIPIITPVTSGITWERPTDPLRSPAEVIPEQRSVNPVRNYQWRAVSQPVFRKKGGKIEKGQSGLKTVNLSDDGFTNWFNQKQRDEQLQFEKTLNQPQTIDTPSISEVYGNGTWNLTATNPADIEHAAVVKMRGRNTPLDQITEGINQHSQGTFSAEKYNPDLNVPLNWARSLYAMKQSDKQLENFLNRPKYQMQGPILNAPRYVNTGTGNAYRTQADNTRISKPVTSDAMQNDLMQRSRQQEARQLELQGALADSQEYGQYKAGLDEFINNNILRNTDIANQNAQLRWQHGIEDVQAKNANIAEKSKFFDQAAYATQDWYNRNWQMRNQLEASKAYNKDLGKLDEWYRTEMDNFNRLYKDDPNSENAQRALANIKSQLTLKQQGLGYSGLYAQLSPMFKRGLLKTGGKVSSEGKRSAVTYSKDPYPELLLQNTKDSAQAVKQLNDAIIKLLLQTKPINVH